MRDGARRLIWRELLAMVDAVAADLHAAGLKRGAQMATQLPSRVEVIVGFWPVPRQGYL